MKTDAKYSHIKVCPVTGDQLFDNVIYNSDGVCPHCGNQGTYNVTHYNQIVGRWNRPNLIERVFQGERSEFITKEDEDKIMNALKGEF